MPHTPMQPDDMKVGQFVTIYSYKPRDIFCNQCGDTHSITPPNSEFCGEPFRITAICFPYVAVVYLGTKLPPTIMPHMSKTRIDTRLLDLMAITPAFVKAMDGIPYPKPPVKVVLTPVEPASTPITTFHTTMQDLINSLSVAKTEPTTEELTGEQRPLGVFIQPKPQTDTPPTTEPPQA